ncbi:hypothetical protein JOE65_001907 [Arthrobacter roseus]|nr:hypothetical protein [Arthrobacter roseus]
MAPNGAKLLNGHYEELHVADLSQPRSSEPLAELRPVPSPLDAPKEILPPNLEGRQSFIGFIFFVLNAD